MFGVLSILSVFHTVEQHEILILNFCQYQPSYFLVLMALLTSCKQEKNQCSINLYLGAYDSSVFQRMGSY